MKKGKKYNDLTLDEQLIIIHKHTEPPFSGRFHDLFGSGLYLCRQCGKPLYHSTDKFKSNCGWPSFDDEIAGAINRETDADGSRIEILCSSCNGHLGHIFQGEKLTEKNIRHCVNSTSLKFVPAEHIKKAYFAGGCFWGVEYYLNLLPGVLDVISGYMGGEKADPTYEEVCTGNSGYLEAVEVIYDNREIEYEIIAREFFEIHDPTQENGQGPDIGAQYRSAIFVSNNEERETVATLITILEQKNFKVVTKILEVVKFYSAEEYHQHHYERAGSLPYCHGKIKRF